MAGGTRLRVDVPVLIVSVELELLADETVGRCGARAVQTARVTLDTSLHHSVHIVVHRAGRHTLVILLEVLA